MARKKHTNETLRAEIRRLRNLNNWLSERLAEAERRLGVSAPVAQLQYEGHRVRVLMHNGEPVVLADDLIELVPNSPKRERRGDREYSLSVQRFRRLGLGAREAVGIARRDLAQPLGITERGLSMLLGVSTRVNWVGLLTARGVEALRTQAPALCAWIEREAFPAVIERFGKGGAS